MESDLKTCESCKRQERELIKVPCSLNHHHKYCYRCTKQIKLTVKWKCVKCNMPLGYIPKDSVCPNPTCKWDSKDVYYCCFCKKETKHKKREDGLFWCTEHKQ